MDIENTLDAGQSFVGGSADVYPVTDYLNLFFNEKGVIKGLEVRDVGEGR